mmetsp:Transcript_35872/g.99142  ORF Transcript_35872/g.99142 Transcript_35872/m.99142 type:complete len:234 (+) Transcript_35872:181-882(+)
MRTINVVCASAAATSRRFCGSGVFRPQSMQHCAALPSIQPSQQLRTAPRKTVAIALRRGGAHQRCIPMLPSLALLFLRLLDEIVVVEEVQEERKHGADVRIVEDPREHHRLGRHKARDAAVRPDDGETYDELADLHGGDQELGGVCEAGSRDRKVGVHHGVDERVEAEEDPQALILENDAEVDVPRRAKVVEGLEEADVLPLEHEPRRVQVLEILGVVEGPRRPYEELAVEDG